MLNTDQEKWLLGLFDSVPAFLDTLADPARPGKYLPCAQGATEVARKAGLGFSCFALKTLYSLGRWENLPPSQRRDWVSFIQSFQVEQGRSGEPLSQNAFWDQPVMRTAYSSYGWRQRLRHFMNTPRSMHLPQLIIIAETKQAAASLMEVGSAPLKPYLGCPLKPDEVLEWLGRLPWQSPWGAGAQSCQLAAFLRTQWPAAAPAEQVSAGIEAEARFLDGIADEETGTYFKGDTAPSRSQLINGAMKVLTALDWLEHPVRHPEKLIDTCLQKLPSPDGCHLVDWVYVLYRCLQTTRHRLGEIQEQCLEVLEMIRRHHNHDGGFSYQLGGSQRFYYGLIISEGLAESDIHGTCLLTWALAMITHILERDDLGFLIIKP